MILELCLSFHLSNGLYNLLNAVADLIDSKKIKTILTDQLSPINAENLRKAHKKLESGRMIGKIALSGF